MADAIRSENADLAQRLDRIADRLAAQGANPFRVGAYRRAADTVRGSERALADVFQDDGVEGLIALPGIGRSIASLVREYVRSGRISLLERLEGEVSAETLLTTIPGLGPELARRAHDELGIDSLEALEVACWNGSLASLRGFGPRRVAAIAASVGAALGRAAGAAASGGRKPSVAALLDVDAEYRRRAGACELSRIAPRRFNPEGRAWLPVLHTERDGWHFTALFSNTARAHELGKTDDWVVIYADRDGEHDQSTLVTDSHAPGGRVVRGRELECVDRTRRRGFDRPGSNTAWGDAMRQEAPGDISPRGGVPRKSAEPHGRAHSDPPACPRRGTRLAKPSRTEETE